jgi:hypothetical protein
MTITEPGLYDMPAADYHADPCAPISLSRGIAHMLIRQSPEHAHWHHPKLGGHDDIEASHAMDDGSVIHELLLGKGGGIVPLKAVYGPKHELAGLPVRDYRTKDASEERDAIVASGKTPVLPHRLAELQAIAKIAEAKLLMHPEGGDFFAAGRSEVVGISREEDTLLRIMVDRLPDDPKSPPYDLKLTKLSAAPGGWERRFLTDYAFQGSFYSRVLAGAEGFLRPPMRFVVIESEPPHGVVLFAAAPSLIELASRDVEKAIRTWRHCLTTDSWPGYPPFTCWVEAKPWQIIQMEEQEMRDEMMESAQ